MKRRFFEQTPDLRDESGIYIFLLALVLVPLFFVVGLALDSAKLEIDSLRVQRAADAATMAGSSRIGELSDSAVLQLAQLVIQDNFTRNGLFYDVQHLPDYMTAAFNAGHALSVTTRTPSTTYIIGKVVGEEGQGLTFVRGRATGERRRVALVLVADVTGSMQVSAFGLTKIDALKAAARRFVDVFDEKNDFVSLVSYSTALNAQASAYLRHRSHNYSMGTDFIRSSSDPAQNRNFSKSRLGARIDSLQASGRTNIESGMVGGIEEVHSLPALIGAEEAASYMKVIVVFTDGSPNENSGDFDNAADPSRAVSELTFPPGCPDRESSKKDFIYPLLLGDWARRNETLVFAVGLGEPAPPDSEQPFYQGGTDNNLRPYFLRRLANAPSFPTDPETGEPVPDPELAAACLASYAEVADYSRGEFLQTPDPNQLDNLLQQIARSIQFRLIE